MNRYWAHSILFCILIMNGVQAQYPIFWGGPGHKDSEFDGGLNGWTTTGLASSIPDSAINAVWTYSKTSDARPFIFGGGTPSANVPIHSFSNANGAAVFNSAYLDTRGVFSNLGTDKGPAPALSKMYFPDNKFGIQSGVLTSPKIDCSSQSTVAVWFFQLYYKFYGKTSIEVTHDGGVNWQEFLINIESPAANNHVNNRLLVDITSAAAGYSEVQFRFKWSNAFYFWIIDDVYLVNMPDHDLAITHPYYSPSSYAIPISQTCQDSLIFKAALSNLGTKTQRDVVFACYVENNMGLTFFADSIIIPEFKAFTKDSIVYLTSTFKINNLPHEQGLYKIIWKTYSLASSDAILDDNIVSANFEITAAEESVYAKEQKANGSLRFPGNYLIGAQYITPDCIDKRDDFEIKSVLVQLASTRNSGSPGRLEGYQVVVYILKVKDTVNADFSNFALDIDLGDSNGSVEFIGVGDYTCNEETNFEDIYVPVKDINEKKIYLEPNTRYFILVDHLLEIPGTFSIEHAADLSSLNAFETIPFNTPVYLKDKGLWLANIPGNPQPVCRLKVSPGYYINTKNVNTLSPNTLTIKSNPVIQSRLELNIQLEETSDVQLLIADIHGKIISKQYYKSIDEQIAIFDLSNYTSGMYVAKLITKHGTRDLTFSYLK
ncbi:MAG: hypothetical protein IPO85_06545 [Saprospiraceae bacterium]|uniref:Secretion system C-terminal sorting domain-containing protein n=1 Tax=Candidatus Defluviibacterium haderslevense TaxID=2981993 RepID=A0A9D7XCU4_9BACT|nr:hypothetical protein [Candidatus Defluviibacterium haderslevense]